MGMSFSSFLKTFGKIEPLSNFQIVDECEKLKIKNFKGVFMRGELRVNKNMKADRSQCLALNIDHSSNDGTHWTSVYIKKMDYVIILIVLDTHPTRSHSHCLATAYSSRIE